MLTRTRKALALCVAIASSALVVQAIAQEEPTLRLTDLSDGVPSGFDAFGNGIGFTTWQDGGGALALSAVALEPGDPLALPDQEEIEHVLRVDHRIASWGGFTQAFADDAFTRWESRDLSPYAGLRFWFKGEGRGGTIQIDLFDNRDPEVTGDSAERWFFRFVDDTSEWRLVEVPFSRFARRTDFQPTGAPNDGLGLDASSGWALGFPPGEGTSLVARVEAYGSSGVVAEGGVTVQFAEPLVVVEEGEIGTLRVVLSEPSDEAVSVRVIVRGDEAEAFRDLVPVDEVLEFPPGVTEATLSFHTLQDSCHEGDEEALAVLDAPRGAALGFERRTIIVIRDDDPFDPDLVADFCDGSSPFEAGAHTTARVVEVLDERAVARPDQDRFERMLSLAWEDAGGSAVARFPLAVDADGADGVEFWYRGDGGGRTVEVELRSGRDAERPRELVWSDEFDGPAGSPPDPTVWTPELGDGSAEGIPGWGNAERQLYTDDPANVAHDGAGHLVIRALETHGDGPTCYYGAPCEYTSARIVTAGKHAFTYGWIEARMRLPAGQGLWPAFWTLGTDLSEVGWPESGEIDIMEHIGREPSTVHGTIHGPGYSAGQSVGRSVTMSGGARFADDFHEFGIEWLPGQITWSLDGDPYSTLTPADLPARAPWVFDKPQFLILNLAVGGHWPGYPDESTTFPQELVVDYVRVYGAADTSARFVATFEDDADDWVRVRLPFEAFMRGDAQPEGAPAGGLDPSEVWGLVLHFEGGAGSSLVDEVRWYREE